MLSNTHTRTQVRTTSQLQVSVRVSVMASAYVPPPPEEDFLGFCTQQENTLRQASMQSDAIPGC